MAGLIFSRSAAMTLHPRMRGTTAHHGWLFEGNKRLSTQKPLTMERFSRSDRSLGSFRIRPHFNSFFNVFNHMRFVSHFFNLRPSAFIGGPNDSRQDAGGRPL
jgi:hypothetical protein